MGTIQCTLARLVQPNQKMPMGSRNAPIIAGGRRDSGWKSDRVVSTEAGRKEMRRTLRAFRELWLDDFDEVGKQDEVCEDRAYKLTLIVDISYHAS
jgi:hypothetical protein